MKKKSFDRDSRKHQVVLQFAIWIQNERSEVWATSYKIARALNLEASSHFRAILQEMIDDGSLVGRTVSKSGRWLATEYALKPGTYTPPKKRTVVVNPGRENSAQLEMF